MNKVIIEYTHKRWKSQTNNWGVYFGVIKKVITKSEDFNLKQGQEVCFVGDSGFELKYKQLYSVAGEFTESQYGKQIQIGALSEFLDMNDPVEKDKFLKTILTEKQFNDLKSAFEDPFMLLEKNDRDKLLTVTGIGEVVVDRLLQRFNNTRDNAHVYAYFSDFELTNDFINKMIISYGGGDILLQKFKQNPYVLIDDISGVGFLKADEIAMKSKLVEPDSKERIFAATEYFLSNKLDGSTYIEIPKFKTGMNGLLRNKVSTKLLDEMIIAMYDNGSVYLDKDKTIIGLMKFYMLEKNIALELKRIIDSEPQISIGKTISREEVESEIAKIEKEQGWEYTDEQIRAIKQCFLKNINIIYAYAGTGKTSIVNAVIQILKKKTSIYQVALAGKAAQRMEEVTGYPASTIHRALGFIPDFGFTHHKGNPLTSGMVIIDETSMLPLDLFYDLLVAIPDGCKLIMLGDTGQLESVGTGNLFKDLIESNKIPKSELTKIHRQAQKSAIITDSINVRSGKLIIDKDFLGYDIRGELKDLELEISAHGKNTTENIVKYFKKYYDPVKNNILDIQVVMPKRDDALNINNQIQNIVNPVADEKIAFTKKYEIRVGDKVINRKNNYNSRNPKGVKTPIFNGNIGIVKKIDIMNKILVIDFENIGEIIFDFADGGNLQLGYAITCHSCLTEDTLIRTDKGVKKIIELDNGASVGEFKKITSDIKVFNGKNMEKPSAFYNNGVDSVYRVNTKRGYSVDATRNHRFNVWTEKGFIDKKLSELSIGDYLVLNQNSQIYYNKTDIPDSYYDIKTDIRTEAYNIPKKITPELSRILGCVVADGTIDKRVSMVRFCKRHYDYMEVIKDDVKKVFNYDASIQKSKDKDMFFLEINSRQIAQFINKFNGVQPNDKYVPSLILETTKTNQECFLQGLFEDGSVNIKNGYTDHIELSQKNNYCISQVREMLMNMGIVTTYRERSKKLNKKTIITNTLYIYSKHMEIFRDNIGFMTKFKNDRLIFRDDIRKCSNRYIPYVNHLIAPLLEKSDIGWINNFKTYYDKNIYTDDFIEKLLNIFNRHGLSDRDEYIELQYIFNNYYFEMICDISFMGEKKTYCLEMPETHNFTQNGFILKNSQGSQWDTTIVGINYGMFFLLSREWLYTALTRASSKCVLVAENRALRYSTSLSKINKKKTFLKRLL